MLDRRRSGHKSVFPPLAPSAVCLQQEPSGSSAGLQGAAKACCGSRGSLNHPGYETHCRHARFRVLPLCPVILGLVICSFFFFFFSFYPLPLLLLLSGSSSVQRKPPCSNVIEVWWEKTKVLAIQFLVDLLYLGQVIGPFSKKLVLIK